MKAILIVALLASPAQAGDDWFGPDKPLHFGAAATIAVGGYAVSSVWMERRWERGVAGASLALAAGAAKEGWDATGRGDPSWKDFTWDAIGAAVGVGVAYLVDELWHH